MTKHEKLVVSAYTGTLMTSFGDFHEYVEKLLGYPVFTHEFASPNLYDKLRELVKEEFLDICKSETEEESTHDQTDNEKYKQLKEQLNYIRERDGGDSK